MLKNNVMKSGYVYKLIDPRNNECKYVGVTTQNPNTRLYRHLHDIDKSMNHKNSWLKSLKNCGLLSEVKIEIIEVCDTSILYEREIFWIKEFKNKGFKLTNMTDGGEVGSLGCKHSDTAKKKISKAGKKRLGKKLSEETRKKISLSLIGKPGRNTGNKHSDETKKQISKTKKGTLSWNATPTLQLTLDGEIIREWVSATAAAKELKLSQGNIQSVITGKRKSCGGYKWKLK